MLSVCFREFTGLFKSVKAILVMLFMIASTYTLTYLLDKHGGELLDDIGGASFAGLFTVMFLFGFLCIFSLSHDVLSREIYNRTARFLVTKTARDHIVYGKFLGIFFFWVVCFSISFAVLSGLTGSFNIAHFLETIVFFTFPIALCMLLSVLFSRPGYTMLIGLLVSVTLPPLSFWSITSDNLRVAWFKYLTPYYYATEGGFTQLFTLILSAVALVLTVVIFRRRDL